MRWTSRAVEFDPDQHWKKSQPAEDSPWTRTFDALADHYYGGHRAYMPLVSASHGVIRVGGFPWWVPRPLALRRVTKIAEENGLGGDARFVVERSVLVDGSD